ncbi:hypothetical protein CDAR_115131 [Caerostris darwini]|uniref:Uncharacterized protein n=1 Tax=Caerostris darwini TaxID=1538125 RepID=A0AAV4U7A2_9ARAC|nr:hypothetical protein CDAR_115131 [Caerostris darwini]
MEPKIAWRHEELDSISMRARSLSFGRKVDLFRCEHVREFISALGNNLRSNLETSKRQEKFENTESSLVFYRTICKRFNNLQRLEIK